MKKILAILAFAFLSIAAFGQNLTTVSATNITDLNGTKLAVGQLCFTATDNSDIPISFQIGGGGQALKRPYCSSVTTGVVTSFTVPNPATTLPTGIYYRVTVKDSSTGQEVLRYPLVSFVGTTFNFDAYVPIGIFAGAPLSGNTVTGNLGITGNLNITGTCTGCATGGGTGTVTNVATTSPITGGAITTTGTIACATCVTSTAPGAGVAHFAGATQAVTSSAVDVSSADITGVLKATAQPAHTGDVTNTAGSLAMTIANNAVTQAKVTNGYVDLSSAQTAIAGAKTFTAATTFKVSPWYDITAYGAVCDGATDDTAAIQAALTAANAAHGGTVFVPMGTNACVVAGQLIMDDFLTVSLIGASQASPAGATPRSWLKFTGTTSPLISCKSCNGTKIKGLYLQYSNAAFTGTFIEYGHSASTKDATGNRIEDNFIGKQAAGGTAAVLLSLDQAIDNIVENNQFFDAAVAIRGRNGPTGIAADYSVNNTIRANSMGISSASNITTAFIQNIGEGSVIQGNDFEIGGAAVAVLAYTGAMPAGGTISGGFVGDMSGTSTITLFTIPTNSAWQIEGMVIGAVSTNVTGVVMQNNASLSFTGNKLASGTTIGTMFSVGTGDSLVVDGNKWQGAVSTFLTGTPASGMVEDSTSHVRLPTGTNLIPGITFLQNNAIGFTISANNHLQAVSANPGPFFSNLQIGIGSGMALISNGNADPDAVGADVGLSRGAAGIWYVGTGAAGNKSGFIQSGNTVRVASDFTTAANTSLQTITGLSWTFPAVASSYSFHCAMSYSQATAVVSVGFGIQAATNAPTNIFANGAMQITVGPPATEVNATLPTLTTTTATAIVSGTPGVIGTNYIAYLDGTLELPASANTVNIMVSTATSGDAVTVKRGSYCQLF